MAAKLNIDWKCLGLAFVWFIGNATFGIAPLLFLVIVNPHLTHHEATVEIDKLVAGGIILFVCCALMGAVLIDILLDKLELKKLKYFAFNVSPFILLAVICFVYIMIILGHINASVFNTFSNFYKFVVLFTILYCTLGKYLLYENQKD